MVDFLSRHKTLIIKIVVLSGYGISIPGLWIMRHNPQAFQLSWIFTSFSLVLLLLFHRPFTKRFALAMLAIGIVGWALECIGTNTGYIFGSYTYGNSLGPKFFGTPLSMVVNWMVSIYLVVMVLKPVIINSWRLALAGASFMVLYDILLEPVAIRLFMWSWLSETPPLQNYIAWFVISFPLVMLLNHHVKNAQNPLAIILFACQMGFFAVLNAMIGVWGM